jgi:ferritin-like protein
MKEETQIGLNRTGVQISPLDASDMQKAVASTAPEPPVDGAALAMLRKTYIVNSDPIGSVPLPVTLKGAVVTAFSALTGDHPEILLDKLGERLAFERTGTRLYDALITKVEAMQDGTPSMTMDELRQIRADEARHFSMLVDAIQAVGGDPTAQTPCADVAGVESQGLMQVITDPRTTLGQSLHAILVAELVDQNGWEQLIALAEDNGQDAMAGDFDAALNEERQHLQQVQRWYQEAVLGIAIPGEAARGDEAGPATLH